MNKGLFIHIIASIIYCLMAVYIIGETATNIPIRAWVVLFLLFANFIAVAINDINGFYEQNL